MKKPSAGPEPKKTPKETTTLQDKRDLARQQHSNHFTNRAPGSKE